MAVPLCPSCGATVVPGRERCPACGHPATPTFVMPTLPDDAATVEYDFDGWDDAARAAVTDAFGAAGIAYRWEPDLKLVVAADREQEVDALVDDIRGEPSDPEGDELTPASDEWGEGEDAFAALGNLYDAADRLFHAPANIRAGLDLRAATKAVRDAPPPFGFNAVLWQTAGELGSRLSALLDEGASSEDVQAGAEALRDVLAEHI